MLLCASACHRPALVASTSCFPIRGQRPIIAADVSIPVLVPITGFLSLEGASQRNGALLAMRRAPTGINIKSDVSDTGTSPDVAVNALERALSRDRPTAIVASMLGTQMLAMLPVALEAKVPLLTVSGTARITELKNPYVFRFFPGDDVAKEAHVRYVVEELGKKRIALVYQTTAYGQSGRNEIVVLRQIVRSEGRSTEQFRNEFHPVFARQGVEFVQQLLGGLRHAFRLTLDFIGVKCRW